MTDEQKGYIRGLRAAARHARREALRSRNAKVVQERHGMLGITWQRMYSRMTGEIALARWCEFRARAIERKDGAR